MTVSVTGTSITSTVGGDGSFTLTGVPPGSVELHFSGGGVDARGTLSGLIDQEQVTVTVTITGGTAQFNVQTSEAEGTISGLTGTCPVVTFSAGTTVVSTDATTTFTGGTCLQLANGGKADVKGVKQPDGSIKATKVNVEDAAPPTNPAAELEGTISGLTGVCPAVAFTIGTTKISTDLTTKFSGSTCLQLANGKKADVKGSVQADGSIKATSVESDGGGDGEGDHSGGAEAQGKIAGLTGLCPAISFTVGTTTVTTDVTTSFSQGSCLQLTNGKQVEVKGTKQTDGSIKASEVSLDD